MDRQSGMRVDVWDGAGKESLGSGTYVGDVPLYYFAISDGSIRSMKNAEEKPPDELIAQMEAEGAALTVSPCNPKIELDSGGVVYGCQVWWQRKKLEEAANDTNP